MSSCSTCAWVSPCKTKCFNPHYILMSEDHVLPCDSKMFCCVRYESYDRTEKLVTTIGITATKLST